MNKIKNNILRPKVAEGKKGFVNAQNEWVIAPDYEDVDVFREGVCWVKNGGKWGLVNKNGECLIEPRFEDTREFNQGYANVKTQGKWGVIDRNGIMIFQPEFDLIRTFKDGIAPVVKDNKSGFINIMNQSIIEPIYEDVHDFSQGLAGVKTNGLWGFINLDGDLVIEPQFIEIDADFREDGEEVWAYVEKQGEDKDEDGFFPLVGARIDRKGNTFDQWYEVDCDDFVRWSYEGDPWPLFGIRTIVGFIDTEGNWTIRPKFQEAKSFKDGVAVVKIDDKWGLIEKSGAYIVEPEFDYITSYEDGSYSFEKNNEIIYTDHNFEIISEPIKENSKDNWLDSILKDDCEEEAIHKEDKPTNNCNETKDNYRLVHIKYSAAVVDRDNFVILKDDHETYGDLISVREGMVRTRKDDNFGFVNLRKGEYQEPIFNYIWDFSEGLAAVRLKENPMGNSNS